MVAEVGFEPHDLRVMSPTSYQAALLRDIEFFPLGAGDRGRTGTILSYHGILSPGRLPVPPHRRSSMAFSKDSYIIASVFSFVNPFFEKSKNSFRFFSDFFAHFDRCLSYLQVPCPVKRRVADQTFTKYAILSPFGLHTLFFRC